MDKYAKGSKDIVALSDKKVQVVNGMDTRLLNENSIKDLENIKKTMVDKKIKIDDLQFLIKEDGHIVIADPLKVHLKTKPSNNNLKMINLLIEVAKNKK